MYIHRESNIDIDVYIYIYICTYLQVEACRLQVRGALEEAPDLEHPGF